MKIYVITKGEYSGYHICAATTDKDRAEILKRMASTDGPYGEEAKIEEYDDYAGLSPIEGKAYDVSASYGEDGESLGVVAFDSFTAKDIVHYDGEPGFGIVEKWEYDFDMRYPGTKAHTIYSVTVVARSEDEAEKIGNDMIQEYRAKEMGLRV